MPAIHLMGLPGSGKSTLARPLLAHLGWSRSFRIGTYHKRFPPTEAGDAAAWKAMLDEMAQGGWTRFLFESTGLNERWEVVIQRCHRENVLTIKLECTLPELLRRIALKSPEDQAHGDWFPPDRFRNKMEFVEAMFSRFSRQPAEMLLDTTRATPAEIFDLVERYLSRRPAERPSLSMDAKVFESEGPDRSRP